MSSRTSRSLALLLLAAVVPALVAGCSDDTPTAAPNPGGAITTTTSPPTVKIDPPPVNGAAPSSEPKDATARLVARLKAVDKDRLKLGAEFNKRFVAMELQTFGFEAADAECISAKVAATAGAAFSGWTMQQLVNGFQGLNAAVISTCVSPERQAAVAKRAAAPDFKGVSPTLVRSVFAELATDAFEAGGLTATEATCVADGMVAGMTDDKIPTILKSPSFDDTLITSSLPSCLSAERIASLAS